MTENAWRAFFSDTIATPATYSYQETTLCMRFWPPELPLFLLISKTGFVALRRILSSPDPSLNTAPPFFPDNYACSYYCNQESETDKVGKDKIKIMIDSGIIYAQTVLHPSEVEMLILCSKNRIYKNQLYVSRPTSDVSF